MTAAALSRPGKLFACPQVAPAVPAALFSSLRRLSLGSDKEAGFSRAARAL